MATNGIPAFIRDDSGCYQVIRSTLTEIEILATAEEIIERRFYRLGEITSVDSVKEYLRAKLVAREEEVFCVIYLDNRHRIIQFREEFRGTVDRSIVHARIILREAIRVNAAAVILAHNHPSGIAEPSADDRKITSKIKEVLSLVDVRLVDHLVIGYPEIASFSELGIL